MATVTHDQALANARHLLAGQPAAALAQAQAIIEVVPTSAAAHRLAAHALRALGREEEAQAASLDAVGAAIHDPEMIAAALALVWVLLSGHYDPIMLGLGGLSVCAAMAVAQRMRVIDRESVPVHLRLRTLRYCRGDSQ